MACPDCFGLGFTSISVTKKIKDTWYDVIGIGFFQLLSKPKSQHVKQVMLYLPSSACVRASASVYFWVPFFFFLFVWLLVPPRVASSLFTVLLC